MYVRSGHCASSSVKIKSTAYCIIPCLNLQSLKLTELPNRQLAQMTLSAQILCALQIIQADLESLISIYHFYSCQQNVGPSVFKLNHGS